MTDDRSRAHRRRGLGSSRTTCRSSTPSPRTTSGGARASPSGPTSPGRGRCSAATTSRSCPAQLGFYDLRLPETRAAQADAGGAHGIEAFCYWHYWFAGRRLLERPFREVLESGEPDFGFCLGWANQHWTTIWTGGRSVLVEQTYPGARRPRAPLRARCSRRSAIERYLRVDGRPLFFVYRPNDLPGRGARSPTSGASLAERAGLPGLYLVGETKSGWRAAASGFDAEVQVPPVRRPARTAGSTGRSAPGSTACCDGPEAYPYDIDFARMPRRPSHLPHPELPVVVSNWDNTPRFGATASC